MSSFPRQNLRRSCHFCRARKIKCSGSSICEACKERNQDCIYDVSETRSRRNTSGDRDPTFAHGSPVTQSLFPSPPTSHAEFTNGAEGILGAEGASGRGDTIGQELEKIYGDNCWEKMESFNRRASESSTESAGRSEISKPGSLSYDGWLSLLTQDLVGMIAAKFGGLGCQHIQTGGAKLCVDSLANDQTTTMIDYFEAEPNPLTEYDSRRITQLIEVWFSTHPLSILVSKTLLLRDVRNKTQDDALLAVILADASFAHDHSTAHERGHRLLRFAQRQLQDRKLSDCGFSTAQALTLFGWHELCFSSIRRSTSYVTLASKMLVGLKDRQLEPSLINGIDVREVERELLSFLWWTIFSLTLWSFMQLGHNFSHLLTGLLPQLFLPMDDSSSSLIKLDEASDNLSTLQIQRRVIREMWPLSHVSAAIAHVYALYPQDPNGIDDLPSGSWQERPLQGFRRLVSLHHSPDFASICSSARGVFIDSIRVLKREVDDSASQALLLTVHHTILIHFLFPRGSTTASKNPTQDKTINDRTINCFLESADDLLAILAKVSEGSRSDMIRSGSTRQRSSFPDVFILALDSCGRALELFRSRLATDSKSKDSRVLLGSAARLGSLAARLHNTARDEILASARLLRPVKKRLKTARVGFEQYLGRGPRSVPSPTSSLGSGTTSQPHTPSRSESNNMLGISDVPDLTYQGPHMDAGLPNGFNFSPSSTCPTSPALSNIMFRGPASSKSMHSASNSLQSFTYDPPQSFTSNPLSPSSRFAAAVGDMDMGEFPPMDDTMFPSSMDLGMPAVTMSWDTKSAVSAASGSDSMPQDIPSHHMLDGMSGPSGAGTPLHHTHSSSPAPNMFMPYTTMGDSVEGLHSGVMTPEATISDPGMLHEGHHHFHGGMGEWGMESRFGFH
ncbi:hypothetical protein P152DRAFT_457833 [Eremomyces bilateralis CBS 781.70]|uniref:Zn(2)-C6 fungal-type domain-containing protein n=1 Tax=Eremomyces bilateralis CBS 781.70 TaxID=1392243 RepID=A0A6G1G691_9PEZI|nr:uncharacterized protein P152DRAFT_457833 [Eremomyces bilateralis CBS 781.70]KAF1813471.1 hypothetical protein P152DRAFT_457833 [Eremomyces bilateralis CBS 781.70]